jgi:hypothetical protein
VSNFSDWKGKRNQTQRLLDIEGEQWFEIIDIQVAYKLSEYFAKLYDRCILCNEIVHTTFGSTSQGDHDFQIAVGTRVEPPKIPRHTNYAFSVTISLQHCFTLFPRDGSSDYRTIPNVTFTACNRYEFHDLATLPT